MVFLFKKRIRKRVLYIYKSTTKYIEKKNGIILCVYRYKEGPLVVMPKDITTQADSHLIEKLQSIDAKGVIYGLPADKTYSVDTPEVVNYIKSIVDSFKNTTIKVILDLTPNYVTTEDELYKLALQNENYRSAFVWSERTRIPNNWLSKVPNTQTNGTAWKLAKIENYVLTQFGENNIDLQLSDPIAKEKFKNVLRKLVRMGVTGFRLANAKHYIIDKDITPDQSITNNQKTVHTDYDFWTHTGTTNRPGIGALLNEFWQVVKNETNGDGFLSVTDYIDHPEVFFTHDNVIGFDLPIIVNLTSTLSNHSSNIAKGLRERLSTIYTVNKDAWLQWPYEISTGNNLQIGASEYNIFVFLLPGVPVGTLDDFLSATNATEEIKKLEAIRKSQSYQHGSFDVYSANNDTVIAYSR